MGADSAGVSGFDLRVRSDSKLFRNGPMLFGFTSSFRMGQLLRYSLRVPLHDPEMDSMAYMATAFINAIRECLKEGGYASKTNENESGGTFLVGYQGGLYMIEPDYQVGQAMDGFMACGCGAPYALGALHATEGEPPDVRINKALLAAERHSAGVRRPFDVRVLEPGP